MMSRWKKILIIILCILILFSAGFFFFGSYSEEVGSNNLGHVEKITYSYYGDAPVKIAIISGMHPREKLHQSVLPIISNTFALTHNCKIINYKVTVTSNPDNFTVSRFNGESLVHKYVVSDLKKEGGADLVIIGHDHEEGYGDGYYIATPTMDKPTVNLAKKVTSKIDFNYYLRNKSRALKSSSIKTVDYPILKTKSKVFVYEIPERDSESNAIEMSYKLIEASFKALS